MNKKGDETVAENAPIWLVMMLLIIIVMLGVRYMATSGVYSELQLGNAEANMVIDRLAFSKDCLAFNNSLRTYPGLIDVSKYNQERIKNCVKKPGLAVRLSLDNNTLYNDDTLFRSLKDECNVKKSKIICLNKTFSVVMVENAKQTNSFLDIRVLITQSELVSHE